jgi:DNA replication protein DnaC
MDFNAILQRVTPLVKPQPKPEVDTAKVESYAKMMAKAGYIPSTESLAALKLCLEGYGVIITGNVGTGKTMFFQTLYSAIPRKLFTASEISNGNKPSDIDAWLSQWDNSTFILDDIGSEIQTNLFGTKVELVSMVIEHRAKLKGVQTHITTNLTAKGIRERYGDRILDRINGMCKSVKFVGRSLRNAQAVRVS